MKWSSMSPTIGGGGNSSNFIGPMNENTPVIRACYTFTRTIVPEWTIYCECLEFHEVAFQWNPEHF